MSDLDNFGKVIAEQVQKVTMNEALAWERILRLHVKPKPSWMPDRLWAKIVGMVLIQSEQKQ